MNLCSLHRTFSSETIQKSQKVKLATWYKVNQQVLLFLKFTSQFITLTSVYRLSTQTMNMFGSKDAGLPMHGGARRNNGVSGVPVVNKKVPVIADLLTIEHVCDFVITTSF